MLDVSRFEDRMLTVMVFDAETTTTELGKHRDPSPYHPKNRLVSGHWIKLQLNPSDLAQLKSAKATLKSDIEAKPTGDLVSTSWYYHSDVSRPDTPEALKMALEGVDMFVAHNAKFDYEWLVHTGFSVPELVYCTMIGEYIFARGQNVSLKLSDTASRRKCYAKKGDLIDDMFKKQKMGFEEMPKDVVGEYAEADVLSCAEVLLDQLIDLHKAENISLRGPIDLMNDMLIFVSEIEGNGIRVDREILTDVGIQFRQEKEEIEKRLYEIVEEVMGDTPINLASGDDLSAVIYSRKVKDKKLHKEVFNLGMGPNGKPKYAPRMSATRFAGAVRATTVVARKTMAKCCPECKGSGKIRKRKKDGTPYKSLNICPSCVGAGALYVDTGKTAGLRLSPDGPKDAAVGGFKTDKETLKKLVYKAEQKDNLLAVEFLTKMMRLNAISTYISSFVDGILNWLRPTGLLHPNFNQTIAATGRLSSSKPNFQNQPKGGKFPVRDAVRSRFEGGLVLEADFSGLEFRTAGELSQDPQIISDIFNGKDTHKQTAMIIFEKALEDITKDMRQNSKAYCVPMDSEILTRSGWKTHDQLEVGEDVMTYNSDLGIMEWQPALEKVKFEGVEVTEFGHSHWRVRATPNHRWYGWRRAEGSGGVRYNKPCVFTTEEITSEHNIITAAPFDGIDESGLTANEVSILTWIVTDGTYRFSQLPDGPSRAGGRRHGCTAFIIQKKEEQCSSISRLLEGVDGVTVKVDESGTKRWYLPSKYFRSLWEKSGLNKDAPDWVAFVTRMGPAQRQAFIDVFYAAEGTPRNHGERRFSQNAGILMDALRLALHMNGSDSRITRRDPLCSPNGYTHEIVTERKKAHVTAQRFEIHNRTVEDVWCPRTDNQTWVMRQGNVITVTGNTFAPLYGGMGMSEPPHIQKYFQEFFNIYKGMANQQKVWCDAALLSGIVEIPSGRQYLFKNVRRMGGGRVSNQTNIVNYPVQGFATADIVPLACIRALRKFRQMKLQSLLIVTVHDSIVVDVYPGELPQVQEALSWAMQGVHEEIEVRWGYKLTIPLAIEMEAGESWMRMEELDVPDPGVIMPGIEKVLEDEIPF